MSEPLLTASNLSVAFNGKAAVKGLSFSLHKGETLALVGESGSGKSVTALSILQLLPYPIASHGAGSSITFQGQELVGASEAALRKVRGDRIAMIFQEPLNSLNPLHNIYKQVSEILLVHKHLERGAARRRVLELLNLVGLREPEKRLDALPHQLSGGERQRVMIAMALANDPDILIADEPTTALDVTIQAQVLGLLKRLQKQLGMALLLITHDLAIVRKMATRVAVMQAGEIVETGATEAVFSNPQHSYTQHLLSAEPKGAPPPAKSDAPEVLRGEGIKVYFPIKRGVLKRTVDYVRAVDGVDLTLRAGQTLGLVGESGSGKSTLGYALLRLVESQGTLLFQGQRVDKLSAKAMKPLRREMQIVFQDPYGSLSPRLTVGEIIGEGLKVHARDQDAAAREAAVVAALTEVGLDPDWRHRYPHEFSGGQRQRIAIARALASGPKVVIADESVSALDVSIQAQIVNLLLDLQKEFGLAFLFISHDMAVVERVSHRVAVMYLGQIVEIGPRRAIFENPQHPYTRKLMDAVPVADPNCRKRHRPLLSDEIPSPVRALGDEPVLAPLQEVGPGHFVARHAVSGAF